MMVQKLGDGQHICSACWSAQFDKPEPENNWVAGECDFCKDNNKEKTDKLQEIANTAYAIYGEENGESKDEIFQQCRWYFQNTDITKLTESQIEEGLKELFKSGSSADDECELCDLDCETCDCLEYSLVDTDYKEELEDNS